MARTIIPGALAPIPGQEGSYYMVDDVADIDPSGGANGDVITLVGGVWVPAAPSGSSPTITTNTSTGTVALTQIAARLVVHKATGAASYQFPASPTDRDYVELLRASVGTGTIALDGNGHNIEEGLTSAATFGPSSTLTSVRATYFSTDTVWRLS